MVWNLDKEHNIWSKLKIWTIYVIAQHHDGEEEQIKESSGSIAPNNVSSYRR